jgi:flagellin-like protein
VKANQAFQRSDQAVSPVIGVILMVAITVVLAAVVFVIVGRLSSQSSSTTPASSFTRGTRTLTVAQADPDLRWSDIKAKVICSAGTPGLTLNAATITLTNGESDPVPAAGSLSANDVLGVSCTITTSGTTVSIALTYKPTNSGVSQGTWTFFY